MEKFIRTNPRNNQKNFSFINNNISFKDELNDEQFEVVNNIEGPMIVISGAGSGKTRVITYSVAKLIKDGVKASEIMLVTFTNKAAKEMLERVEKLLGQKPDGIWGGTFHSLANRFIRIYTNLAGLKPRYSIIDEVDARSLLKLSIETIFPHHELMNLPNTKMCYKILSYVINCNKPVKDILNWKFSHLYSEDLIKNLKKIYKNYANRKIKNNLVDFNDLIAIWNKLLDEKLIAQKISEKIKYVLVDEYQDTNYIQSQIILKIANINQNIMIVGDDAQSIYSFRGADFKNLLHFGDLFKDVKKFKITRNYRSTPDILKLANDSIKNNKIQFQKEMIPARKKNEKPIYTIVDDEDEQAKYIVNEIMNYKKKGIPLSEMAILYRSNFHSLKLQNKLRTKSIPFDVRSGKSFFEQAHVKDVIAHYELIFNPNNELAWSRVFSIIPGLGRINAQKIFKNISEFKDPLGRIVSNDFFNSFTKDLRISKEVSKKIVVYMKKIQDFSPKSNPSAIFDTVYNLILNHLKKKYENFEERLKDLKTLGNFTLEFKTISSFLENLNLDAFEVTNNTKSSVNENSKENNVILSTVHRAKGLEWKVVFVISLLESHFPSLKNSKISSEIEEERRIFYVALTRAKDYLHLITPKNIKSFRRNVITKPSRFIIELNDSLYELKDKSNNLYEGDDFDVSLNQEINEKLNNRRKKSKSQFTARFISADELLKKKELN